MIIKHTLTFHLYYLSVSSTWFVVCLRFLYLLLLSLVFTNFVSDEENVTYCATATNDVTPQNQVMGDFINELNMEEMGVFVDNLGMNQRDFQILNDLRNLNQNNTGQANTNRFGWEALGLFIVGSIIIFGISRYGDSIISFLFDVGSQTANAITRSTLGLLQFAQQTGQMPLVRQIVLDRSLELLNDPDTANRVVNGMRRVAELRQQT